MAIIADSLYLAIEILSVGFVAWRGMRWFTSGRGSWCLCSTVALTIAASQLVGVMLICAALGLLYPITVLTAHALVGLCVWRMAPAVKPTSSGRFGWTVESSVLLVLILFVGFMALALSSRGGPVLSDDVQYHIPNALDWIQVHNLWHLPVSDPGYFTNTYPGDGELLLAWVIQPVHGLQFVLIPDLLFGVMLVVSGGATAELLGTRAINGILASTAVVLNPISWQTQIHSAHTDWTSDAGLIAAVPLILAARQRFEQRWLLLAGCALGLAVGSKDSGILPAAVVILFCLSVIPREHWAKSVPAISAGLLALSWVWFVRNGLTTGNPIFPEPVSLGGHVILAGPSSPITRYSVSLASDVVHLKSATLSAWFHLVRGFIGLSAVLSLGALGSVWRWRRERVGALTALLGLSYILIYALTPYTGTSVVAVVASTLRYTVPGLLLASVCACAALPWLRALAWLAVVGDLWTILHGSSVDPDLDIKTRTGAPVVLLTILVIGIVLWMRYHPLSVAPTTLARVGLIVSFGLATTFIALGAKVHSEPGPTTLAVAISHLSTDGTKPANKTSIPGITISGNLRTSDRILVVGVTNVLSAFGAKYAYSVISVGVGRGGATPIANPGQLDNVLKAISPDGVMVGPEGTVGVIAGWSPPGYHVIGTVGSAREYLKNPNATQQST